MVARSPALRPHLVRGGVHRHMCLQEAAHPVDRALLQLRGFLPWVNRDLGVRRQRGDIDRGLQRMPRHVIRQHQHRRVAVPDEVARHAVKKIAHSTELRGGGWHHSAKAARGEDVDIEEPVACRYASAFHFHTTLPSMLGSMLSVAERSFSLLHLVEMLCQPCSQSLLYGWRQL